MKEISSLAKANVKNELVFHHRFHKAMEQLEHAVIRARQGDPQILPIIGPTRVGKSTLLKEMAANYNVSKASYAPGNEVLTINCKSVVHPRMLIDKCLIAAGMTPSYFKNVVAATHAFTNVVRKREYKALVFDEAQEMLEKAKLSTRQIGDFFKQIYDATEVTLIIAGLPTLMPLFNRNEQLRGRALAPIKFYPYWHSATGFEHFRVALLSALEYMSECGWKTPSIEDIDFARRMYVATGGSYGLIIKLFAQIETYDSEVKVANLVEFHRAYSKAMHGAAQKGNPFDTAIKIAEVDMAGAYAEVLRESGATLEVLDDDSPAV